MPEALKPEEMQPIIDWLSVGEFKTIDEFKNNFNKKYLTGDDVLKSKPVKEYIGKIIGGINTNLKKGSKTFGIELTEADIIVEGEDGSKTEAPEKIFESALKKTFESHKKIQDELKGQIGANTDERIKKLTEELNKKDLDLKTIEKFNADLKLEKEKIALEKEEALKVSDTKINEFLRGEMENTLWKDFSWADEANDLSKAGFKSTIKSKVKFELAEKEGNKYLELRDLKSGELIEDPTKKGVSLTPSDYLKREGIEMNKISPVFKINGDGGKGAGDNGGWFKQKENPNNKDFKAPVMAINSNNKLPSTAAQK